MHSANSHKAWPDDEVGGEKIGEKEMENGGSNAKYSGRKRKRERIKEIALLRIKGFASEQIADLGQNQFVKQ